MIANLGTLPRRCPTAKTVFVTTKWSDLRTEKNGSSKEAKLLKVMDWKKISAMARWPNPKDSAPLNIMNYILGKEFIGKAPEILKERDKPNEANEPLEQMEELGESNQPEELNQ
ncbi:hypothetical protein H0H81_002119 [Sphagnurus paluster]|uniref:Uncharacterized protein n=1 Tax=Sphagnurus paluster TaxID=117069 RepID=A0A9P7K2L9_9AGAR|nr:hypothetical protein H0H81_002119 [Sphagnurus paluster]